MGMMSQGSSSSDCRNSYILTAKAYLSVVSVHCLAVLTALAQPKRIDIGALFHVEASAHAQAAFKFQVDRHNSQSSAAIILEMYGKPVDISDNFQLTRTVCLSMSNGVYAFLGSTNASSSATVESFGRTFRIPYVIPNAPDLRSITLPGDPPPPTPSEAPGITPGAVVEDEPYIVYMSPPYIHAVFALVKLFRWTRLHYLYDTTHGLYQLERLYEAIEEHSLDLEVDVHFVSNSSDCYALLRDLDASHEQTEERHIILEFSTTQALQSVLNQILHVGMHRNGYHYILGGLAMDDLDLSSFRFGGVNMTGFRLYDETSPVAMETARDWYRWQQQQQASMTTQRRETEKISLGAALTIDAVQVVLHSLRSLFAENPDIVRTVFRQGHVYNNGESRGLRCKDPDVHWIYGKTVMKHMTKARFAGLSGPVAFNEQGHRRDFNLDIVSLRFENFPTKVGSWNDTYGLDMLFSRKGHDLYPRGANSTYIVTTLLDEPYVMFRKKQTDDGVALVGNDRYHGFCAELAGRIATIVRFSYTLRIVGDGMYGAQQENGSWNGMIGELTRREADIAIAPLTITSARERVVDFSMPFMKLGISIMIKKPEKQKPGVFSFMDPLSMEIWTCIAFSYLGVSLTLFLVSRFSPYEWHIEEGENGPTFTNDFTLLNSLWFSLGAFMQQGCDISPRSLSGRLAGSSWWFFTLIIISTYTANLAAFLTVERMLTPINSADDLVKQSEIRYGTLDAGSSRDFFKNSNISVYKEMWRVMSSFDPSVFVNRTQDGVQKVRTSKGKYAFLLESTMNDFHNQRKPCNTMKVGNNFDSKGYGVATPIDHPLRTRIGLAVLQLHETGELTKLQKKWWYDKGECPSEAESKSGSSQSALTLSNVAGIFYILIGGLGFSMVVSLLEFLSKSFRESRRQKKSFFEMFRCHHQRLTSSKTDSVRSCEKANSETEGPTSTTSVVKVVRSSAISLV